MKTKDANQTIAVRRLNDQLRQTFVGGLILITPGVEALAVNDRAALLAQIREFDSFPSGDDPYQEHDFGAIEFMATTYFFKIDYYDVSMEGGSPDPSNPDCTSRVMTILRADEYRARARCLPFPASILLKGKPHAWPSS
jgi:hypothetical protein